jgi:hypothetical protein
VTAEEADMATLPHPEAAEDVSALVVAIERYATTDGVPSDIPGSALAAARFVERLVTTGACLPSRITFAVSYDEDDYPVGTDREALSPASWLTRFREDAAFAGINIIEHAERDADFTGWVTDARYGPRPEDKHFVLFWIGHAQGGLKDGDEQVYLFCSDATEYQPRNVELLYLVRTVTMQAPGVEVSGFIHACQRAATQKARKVLEQQRWSIDIGGRDGGEGPLRRASLLYASAHGETTATAGPDGEIFANAVVTWLEDPANGSRDVILTADSASLGEYLKARGFRPYHKRYSPEGRDIPTPRDESVVSPAEWDELIRLAGVIDKDHGTSAPVRWGAYCHAVGLLHVDMKMEHLLTLTDLFVAVSDSPQGSKPPPLLVAADFVAYRSDPAHLDLLLWCEAWADARREDGERVYRAVKQARLAWVERRPYLSITVARTPPEEPKPATPGRQTRAYATYDLLPWLFLSNYPEDQQVHGPVDWVHILTESQDIIKEASASHATAPDEMLVEFVLQPGLLGWWLEYDDPPDLGGKHPVVIRDLDRAWFPAVDIRAQQRQRDDGSPPADQLAWLTCDEGQRITMSAIGDAVKSAACLVLERPGEGKHDRGDVPPVPAELAEALQQDALMVISVQPGNKCGGCFRAQPSESADGVSNCPMSAVRKMLTEHLLDTSRWPGGLDDLPFIIKEIRRELAEQQLKDAMVSVFMQEPGRLWAGYSKLASGYSPETVAGR